MPTPLGIAIRDSEMSHLCRYFCSRKIDSRPIPIESELTKMPDELLQDSLPEGFFTFKDLQYDYPELTPTAWEKLAKAINVPVIKLRASVVGRSVRKTIKGLTWDSITKIEETYRPLRQAELDRARIEEEAHLAAIAQQEAREQAIFEARREAARVAQAEAASREVATKEAERIANAEAKAQSSNDGAISSNKLAKELEISQGTLDRIAANNGIKSKFYRFPLGPGGIGYNKEQSDALRQIVDERCKHLADENIHSLASIRKDYKIGKVKLKGILAELGIGHDRYLFGSTWGDGISSEDFKVLATHLDAHLAKRATRNVKSIYSLSCDLSISSTVLKRLAAGAGIKPKRYRFRGHRGLGLTNAEVETIRQAYAPGKLDGVLPISVRESARARNMAPETMKKLAIEAGLDLETHRFGNKSGLGITPEQLAQFDAFLATRSLQPIPEDVKPVKYRARSANMAEKTLRKLAQGAQIEPKKYLVRGTPTNCFSDEDMEKIRQAYDPEEIKKILPVSIRKYARMQRTNRDVVLSLAEGAGVELETYLFGGRQNIGLTTQNIADIEKAYEGLPRIEFSDDTTSPLGAIAKEEGIHIQTLRKLIDGTDIQARVYRFPNGKDLVGLRRAQVDELKLTYRNLAMDAR